MRREKMKRIVAAVILVAMILVGNGIAEQETEKGFVAKVTVPKGTLRMRAKPSDKSRVLCEIRNGTCLLVLEEGDTWCKVTAEEKTGYCKTSCLIMMREADPALAGYHVLLRGDKNDEVLAVKERLQSLGYFREGATLTNAYTDTLTERIRIFQRQNGLDEDGVVSQELQMLLFSDRAKACSETLPPASHGQIPGEMNRVFCGCCFGEGCECCKFTGWIYY